MLNFTSSCCCDVLCSIYSDAGVSETSPPTIGHRSANLLVYYRKRGRGRAGQGVSPAVPKGHVSRRGLAGFAAGLTAVSQPTCISTSGSLPGEFGMSLLLISSLCIVVPQWGVVGVQYVEMQHCCLHQMV